MKSLLKSLAITLSTLGFTASTLAAAQLPPAFGPLTREQVRSELTQAQGTGDLPANNESGRLLNEEFPSQFPAKPQPQGRSREEVRAELKAAQRDGDMVVNDESGLKMKDRYPHLYAGNRRELTQGEPAKSREEVRSELREAQLTGDIMANDESGLTLNQLYPRRFKRS